MKLIGKKRFIELVLDQTAIKIVRSLELKVVFISNHVLLSVLFKISLDSFNILFPFSLAVHTGLNPIICQVVRFSQLFEKFYPLNSLSDIHFNFEECFNNSLFK